MTWENVVAVLGFLSMIVGSAIGIAGFLHNKGSKTEKRAREEGGTQALLINIQRGVEEIRMEQKEERAERMKSNERLALVEQSTRSAHKRLDELTGKGGK